MSNIMKSFWRFIGEKVELFLILTYNISNDELRKGLEEILKNNGFADQEDQSTYTGTILYQYFDNFKKELLEKIIQNDAMTSNDFIHIYTSSSKINKHSLKK